MYTKRTNHYLHIHPLIGQFPYRRSAHLRIHRTPYPSSCIRVHAHTQTINGLQIPSSSSYFRPFCYLAALLACLLDFNADAVAYMYFIYAHHDAHGEASAHCAARITSHQAATLSPFELPTPKDMRTSTYRCVRPCSCPQWRLSWRTKPGLVNQDWFGGAATLIEPQLQPASICILRSWAQKPSRRFYHTRSLRGRCRFFHCPSVSLIFSCSLISRLPQSSPSVCLFSTTTIPANMYLIPPIRFSPFQVKSVPSSSGQDLHPFFQPQTSPTSPTSSAPNSAQPTSTIPTQPERQNSTLFPRPSTSQSST
ncbi:unnamed protein product [Periconia digitata]|uniref:Uncharacterized protein n=1 Tax=Periconia digitata TaxID=1303443 RepID=A0A9W4XIC4_9PLEO|nr:unnamed protein product [Periconia digitata]